MFTIAGSHKRIKRLYVYQFNGASRGRAVRRRPDRPRRARSAPATRWCRSARRAAATSSARSLSRSATKAASGRPSAYLDWRAVPSFCRHGRLEANCPICSKKGAAPGAPAGPRAGRAAAGLGAPPGLDRAPARRRRRPQGPPPGPRGRRRLRARARPRACGPPPTRGALADELAFSVARLDELARRPARALRRGRRGGRPRGGPLARLPHRRTSRRWRPRTRGRRSPPRASRGRRARSRTSPARPAGPRGVLRPARAAAPTGRWAARAGSQSTALEGDPLWAPERRFDRGFERLALPGFGRAQRYELLTVLRHLGGPRRPRRRRCSSWASRPTRPSSRPSARSASGSGWSSASA